MSDKESIPSKLWEIVATLTENMQQAAVRKAQDSGYDLEAGQIPFQETLINLSHDRDVLREAVEKGRIVQLPLKLQYRLLAEATKVKVQLEALVTGTDSVVPLESAVEDLSATIWQFNLQNLSPEVLSFETKMNDLKAQETQVRKILSEARKVENAISRLNDLHVLAEERSSKTGSLVQVAEENSEKLGVLLERCEKAEQDALGAASVVQQHETDIASSAASARDASAEIALTRTHWEETKAELDELRDSYAQTKGEIDEMLSSAQQSIEIGKSTLDKSLNATNEKLEKDVAALIEETTTKLDEAVENSSTQLKEATDLAISNFEALESEAKASEMARQNRSRIQLTEAVAGFEEAAEKILTGYKSDVKEIKETAALNIEKHDKEAERLTQHLAELEGRIQGSIERATGYTLFHSFQKRQFDLAYSKKTWAWALLGCVLASLILSGFLVYSVHVMHGINALFFVKLSISLPIIFAISFCSLQYSKERRLEEEYAFKSAISISLEPYQKLVGQLVNHEDVEEKAKYTTFIISSINRVFTSPTGLVFDAEETSGGTATDLLKTAGGIAESLVKLKVK